MISDPEYPRAHASFARSYDEASNELSRLIAQRYGEHPGVLDLLAILAVPVRRVGTRKQVGSALLAYPRHALPDAENMIVAYYETNSAIDLEHRPTPPGRAPDLW